MGTWLARCRHEALPCRVLPSIQVKAGTLGPSQGGHLGTILLSGAKLQRREFVKGAALVFATSHLPGCQRSGSDSNQLPLASDPPPPEYVFVPAPGFLVQVTIDVPTQVKVGQAVRLRAKRESFGQWQKVRWATLPPEAIWYTTPWPEKEPEVAANLTWQTDPPLAARYDVGLKSIGLGMEREAVFKAAGSFSVWALTATPLPGKSNVLRVEVKD
jgi:hypothetical protein